ncbi:endonuclease/exonuclease/phosphatase family protein [Cooperia oncophora]
MTSPSNQAGSSDSRARTFLKIAAVNVRGLCSQQRLADFEANVRKVKFTLIGLSETRRPNRECLQLGSGFVLYNSGRCDDTPTYAGVGFYMSTWMNKKLVGIRYISDRVIQAEFLIRKRRLRIIQVHAPTSAAADDEYERFLDEVEAARHPFRSPAVPEIIFGDFNAVIGRSLNHEPGCGPHATGRRNDRGTTLLSFCSANGLLVANTFFKKRFGRKWTWRSPNGTTRTEIDHVLCPNLKFVRDVTTLSGCNVGSDHRWYE